MENNIYLDKVVEFLVRGTKIDYDKDEIQYPFYPSPLSPILTTHTFFFPYPTFSKYCIDVYGLTDQEIGYVWVMYKSIIKDKIENGK